MTQVACPALRSDDTLGFLAALGVLEVVTSMCGMRACLGWEGVGGAALVHVDLADRDALVSALHGAARAMASRGQVIPAPDEGLVPAPLSDQERKVRREAGQHVEYDPMRLLPDEAVRLYSATAIGEERGDLGTSRWLVALVNQLSSERNGPARALTPLYSPSGRMSLYQIFRDARDDVVGEPALLLEALQAWRRRPGTGANLDARALHDGVVTADGRASNRAVLGASWLALMAAPLFPQVGGAGAGAAVVGWDMRAKGGPRLRWPIWEAPLDQAAVETLLSHPAVARAFPPTPEREQSFSPGARTRERRRRDKAVRALHAMGVRAVCEAGRQSLAKAAGPLLPPTVTPVPGLGG
jgi:hypothetical protein